MRLTLCIAQVFLIFDDNYHKDEKKQKKKKNTKNLDIPAVLKIPSEIINSAKT